MSEKLSLDAIIDAMPLAERTALSAEYSEWCNLKLHQYCEAVGIESREQPDETGAYTRKFQTEEAVIAFFRTALLYWYRLKPKVTEVMTPLDALKTRTCLGQIMGLTKRLEATDIPMRKLKLNDFLT